MKTALVTLQFGERTYFELSKQHLEEYTKVHGYDLIINKGETFPDNRDLRWSKVPALLNALADYEQVLYMDADSVVVDIRRPLSELQPLLGDKVLLLGEDSYGWANTGIILCTQQAIPILKVWNGVPMIWHETRQTWPVDELGFNSYVLPRYRENIALHKRAVRTDTDFIRGTFFHHFANGSQEKKAELIRKHIG